MSKRLIHAQAIKALKQKILKEIFFLIHFDQFKWLNLFFNYITISIILLFSYFSLSTYFIRSLFVTYDFSTTTSPYLFEIRREKIEQKNKRTRNLRLTYGYVIIVD